MLTDWQVKAKFLRDVGALHGEWDGSDRLTKLTLGPPPVPASARPADPPKPKGLVAKMVAQHDTLFAASRFKPPFVAPAEPEAAVPRAVRAKREAAAHGPKKASKRG